MVGTRLLRLLKSDRFRSGIPAKGAQAAGAPAIPWSHFRIGKACTIAAGEIGLSNIDLTLPIRLSPTPTICSVSPWTAGKGRRRRIEEAIRLILDCSENRTGV